MPVRIRTSKELGLSVVAFDGIVTAAEFDEVSTWIAEPKLALLPLALADLRMAVRLDLPSELIRSVARLAGDSIDDQIGPNSRMALVAEDEEAFGLSRMYESLRHGSPVEFGVFRSLQEAEMWLDLPEGYETQLSHVI